MEKLKLTWRAAKLLIFTTFVCLLVAMCQDLKAQGTVVADDLEVDDVHSFRGTRINFNDTIGILATDEVDNDTVLVLHRGGVYYSVGVGDTSYWEYDPINDYLWTKDDVGNVGIGVSTPDNTLDIDGDIDVKNQYLFGGNNMYKGFGSGSLTIGDNGATSASGSYNTIIGYNSGGSLTSGSSTTIIGANSGGSYTTQTGATVIGVAAAQSSTDPESIFIGYYAGRLNTGTENTFIGYKASGDNAGAGGYNVAIGPYALQRNTSGQRNTAIGRSTLSYNTTGNYNVAIAMYAGRGTSSATDTEFSTFIGYGCGYNLSSGTTGNTFISAYAGFENTSGSKNNAIGGYALRYNTTGSNNAAIGYQAMQGTSTEYQEGNSIIGYQAALYASTGFDYNTGVGFKVMANATTTGEKNSAIGNLALFSLTTGDYNTAVGNGAGYSITTGSSNVFIGNQAGYSETGNNKLYIDVSSTSDPLIYGDFSTDRVGINKSDPRSSFDVEGDVDYTYNSYALFGFEDKGQGVTLSPSTWQQLYTGALWDFSKGDTMLIYEDSDDFYVRKAGHFYANFNLSFRGDANGAQYYIRIKDSDGNVSFVSGRYTASTAMGNMSVQYLVELDAYDYLYCEIATTTAEPNNDCTIDCGTIYIRKID